MTDIRKRKIRVLSYLTTLIFAVASISSCISLDSERDSSIKETQIELNVRQTIAAQQAARQHPTISSVNSTLVTSAPISIPTQPLTQTSELPAQETPATTQATEPPSPITSADFEKWMSSASILLYEDMVNNPNTNRYVKDTLKAMGIECSQKGDLPCRDVGSAQGWFRSDLKNGSIDGKPWDLVILASEHKSGVNELKSSLPSDFFGLVLETIDQGIPVILEVGDLDRAFNSNARELLTRCQVSFESDWIRIPPSRMVMFPLVESHPVLEEPNPQLSFTNVTSLWTTKVKNQYYDLGDLVKLNPGSSAVLLVGTTASEPIKHGTLTYCIDGMLIMQTFSSHQLTFNSMKLVWENYIYNQLRLRFASR